MNKHSSKTLIASMGTGYQIENFSGVFKVDLEALSVIAAPVNKVIRTMCVEFIIRNRKRPVCIRVIGVIVLN